MLRRAHFTDELISMEKLVRWQDMVHAKRMSRGPGTDYIRNDISWFGVLKLFVEVIF